jgi:hypothetical protein
VFDRYEMFPRHDEKCMRQAQRAFLKVSEMLDTPELARILHRLEGPILEDDDDDAKEEAEEEDEEESSSSASPSPSSSSPLTVSSSSEEDEEDGRDAKRARVANEDVLVMGIH